MNKNKKYKIKLKKNNLAVAELIGSVLLIAIAISAFSLIYMYVLSDSGPSPESHVKIVGKLESGDVVFENRRGESLGLNTQVFLSLGGRLYNMNINDNLLLSEEDKEDGFWDIGERLVYSEMNISGLQVESTIVDKATNSIVMWGILQEGDIIEVPGAIWHFDENGGYRAFDSLNNNTGYLRPDSTFGPKWENTIRASGASSLKFDGINDHVFVQGDSVSLDITDYISIEAWIKFAEDSKLNNFKYGPAFGYEPDIIHVSGNVYAVMYRDQAEWGVLKSVKIADDGTITEDIHNNSIFVSDKCYWPKIVHVSGDIYMIAFIQSDVNPKFCNLRTVRMLDNGTTGPVLGSHTFGAKEVYDHCLIGISDNVTALVYRDNQDTGIIKTITVTDDGTNIDLSKENSSLEFENWNCFEPNILRLSGNIYAIAYRGNDSFGYLKTVEIADNGTVSDQVIDTFIFDSINRSYTPQLIHVSGNIYGIVYRAETKNGILVTVEISEEGLIADHINDSLLYETDYSDLPKIIHMHNDIFLIAYQSDQTDGYIAEISIAANGSISDSVLSQYKFNTGKNYHGLEPDPIRVNDNIYGVAFRSGSEMGTPHEGHLNTYSLHNYNPGGVTIPEGDGIIYKNDSYGIYANYTHVAGIIGDRLVTEELALSPFNWNHLVLTYDGSYIRLYCNGTEVITEYYDKGITRNTNEIIIGNNFFGYIDEVAIYARVLSLANIINHYNNPGQQ